MQHDMTADYKDMYIAAAAYSPDGKVLALTRGGEAGEGPVGKVFLVDPATGKKTRELGPGHLCGATDVAFHPDGKHVASCGRDTQIRIWNTEDGTLVKELGKQRGGQFKDWIHAISFSADGLVAGRGRHGRGRPGMVVFRVKLMQVQSCRHGPLRGRPSPSSSPPYSQPRPSLPRTPG